MRAHQPKEMGKCPVFFPFYPPASARACSSHSRAGGGWAPHGSPVGSRRIVVVRHFFLVPLALFALVTSPGVRAAAQTDLDDLMARVLAQRDENWKVLQQYVLDEQE